MACLINEAQVKYDDGQDDDNDVQEDEGALCCQGASVLLQEKLTNWLAVRVLCVRVCVLLDGLDNSYKTQLLPVFWIYVKKQSPCLHLNQERTVYTLHLFSYVRAV